MKNISLPGCVVNIILFVVYVLVTMFVAGVLYGALSGGQADASMYDKIGYFVILLVLIVTAIFRKFFYKTIWKESTPVVTEKKEEQPMKTTKKKPDGKMKIYVDKEIK